MHGGVKGHNGHAATAASPTYIYAISSLPSVQQDLQTWEWQGEALMHHWEEKNSSWTERCCAVCCVLSVVQKQGRTGSSGQTINTHWDLLLYLLPPWRECMSVYGRWIGQVCGSMCVPLLTTALSKTCLRHRAVRWPCWEWGYSGLIMWPGCSYNTCNPQVYAGVQTRGGKHMPGESGLM